MQCHFFPHYRNGTAKTEANPFEEGEDGEWDEGDGDNILVDNGEPGVPVKALYDYDGAESDELTFKQGKNQSIFEIMCFVTIAESMGIPSCMFDIHI